MGLRRWFGDNPISSVWSSYKWMQKWASEMLCAARARGRQRQENLQKFRSQMARPVMSNRNKRRPCLKQGRIWTNTQCLPIIHIEHANPLEDNKGQPSCCFYSTLLDLTKSRKESCPCLSSCRFLGELDQGRVRERAWQWGSGFRWRMGVTSSMRKG